VKPVTSGSLESALEFLDAGLEGRHVLLEVL